MWYMLRYLYTYMQATFLSVVFAAVSEYIIQQLRVPVFAHTEKRLVCPGASRMPQEPNHKPIYMQVFFTIDEITNFCITIVRVQCHEETFNRARLGAHVRWGGVGGYRGRVGVQQWTHMEYYSSYPTLTM